MIDYQLMTTELEELYNKQWLEEIKAMFNHIAKCENCEAHWQQWFTHYWDSPERYNKNEKSS